MIKFYRPYQSIKKFGTAETDGIADGKSYVFSKIDGTNASCWFDGEILQAGSRRRQLEDTDNGDNAGFCKFVRANEKLLKFFQKYPDLRLYGEWLVPHSLKTYRDDAWRKFYIFDVVKELETDGNEDSDFLYLSYDEYQPILEEFGLDYINPLGIVKNASPDQYLHYLSVNGFLIKDGEGQGEGVVIKNYDYANQYGRIVWAKIVTNEFKEKHYKTMGAPEVETKLIEEKIVEKYVTEALVDKEYSKIVHEQGDWNSKFIPRLLNTVYYCLITEELWSVIKEFKNPSINFKALNNFTVMRVKEVKRELF